MHINKRGGAVKAMCYTPPHPAVTGGLHLLLDIAPKNPPFQRQHFRHLLHTYNYLTQGIENDVSAISSASCDIDL